MTQDDRSLGEKDRSLAEKDSSLAQKDRSAAEKNGSCRPDGERIVFDRLGGDSDMVMTQLECGTKGR
jgi:hypothetical protein